MKIRLYKLKFVVLAALMTGFVFNGLAADPVEYLEPVYKTAGDPVSGIDHWVTNTVSDYVVVESYAGEVTWGEAGMTRYYVAQGTVEIRDGVTCLGNVKLILCDGANLICGKGGDAMTAGIEASNGSSLTICGQRDGTGELIATGGYSSPGIGNSNITINGGKVTAKGAFLGAGIGGWYQGSGSHITINGGRVNAISKSTGAGIGGGSADQNSHDASGSYIVLNGGKIYVRGHGDIIGSGAITTGGGVVYKAHDNRIALAANVFIDMTGDFEDSGVSDVEGFVVLTPKSMDVGSKVLMGGASAFAHETVTLTNSVTHESCLLTVNDEKLVQYGDIKVAVRIVDDQLVLLVGGETSLAEPRTVNHAKLLGVYTNGVLSAETTPDSGKWYVWWFESATAVYQADADYVFQDGSTVMTNVLDTTISATDKNTRPYPTALKDAPVAEIRASDGKWVGVFDSVTSAIINVGDDETISLITNVNESVTFNVEKKSYSFDLAGWTMTPTEGAPVVTVKTNVTVTIRDTSVGCVGSITTGGREYVGNGAGICVQGTLTMFGITVTNCVANGDGGAIYGDANARILLKDCTIKGNSATSNGGGICMVGGAGPNVESGEPPDTTDKLVLIATEITGNTAGGNGAGVYFKRTVKGIVNCFAAGTMIRMADGSEKAVEAIEEGDLVATFDHEGGTNASARVYYAFKGVDKSTPFILEFDGEGGTTGVRALPIVGCHDLLEQGSLKYVTITSANVGQYIGAKFYGADGAWHTLTNVTIGKEQVDYYSIYSAQYQNVYANGLLTVADDVDYLLNIYELDANLKADAEQLAEDFTQYGVMSYEEAATYGVSPEWYVDGGTKYLNIAIGKQLVSKEYAEQLFASIRAEEPKVAMKMMAAPKMMMASATPVMASAEPEPDLKDYEIGRLTLGRDVVVTNNFVGTAANNIYLDANYKETDVFPGYIVLTSSHAGICAGVSRVDGIGQISTVDNVSAFDVELFTSDNESYAVWHYDSGELWIAQGSQIVPPPVVHTTHEVFTNGFSAGQATTVSENTPAEVVYTAEAGYFFADGTTVKTNEVTTSAGLAKIMPPDAPSLPVASVTLSGETTFYGNINDAWKVACGGVGSDPATLKMLANIALTNKLETSASGVHLTFDLNNHVLSSAMTGEDTMIYFASNSGHLEIVDLATKKDEKYFIETDGLWVLTDEPTSLFVKGGVITGAKKTAVWVVNCSAEIRDVSFVGNSTASDGAALYVDTRSVNVYNTRFYGNVAGKTGGAVCGMVDGQFLLKDCDIRHNVAGTNGGGIYMKNKCVLLNTTVTDNAAEISGAGIYFEKQASCLAAGAMILMADGTERAIETIEEGDLVATFDHEGGTNASARVYQTYKGSSKMCPFTLAFDNGAMLSIVGVHDLIEESSRKYVRINAANAHTFIGKRFYGRDGAWHTLTDVTMRAESVDYYSIYSAEHQNVYANGLLTVPDDADQVPNLYELDENLKADPVQLASDIEMYGLVDPQIVEEKYGVDRQYFDDINLKYAYIAIGKGLITVDDLLSVFEAIGSESATTPVLMSAPMMAKGLMLGAMPNEPTLDDFGSFGDGVIVLGANAVVTNNFAGAITNSNIHLATANTFVALTSDHTGVCAGITLSSKIGQFSTTNNISALDVALFTSDDAKYAVRHDLAGEFLKLGYAGIQVGDDAWANITDGTCSVNGTGDMWSYATAGASPLWSYRSSITNLIVNSGVTGVGDRFFENMWYLTDIQLSADVTNIGVRAFKKCYGLTNVVSLATSASIVGNWAFSGCYSLQGLSFEGEPTFGTECYSMQAAIYMRDGIPEIYPIPKVMVNSLTEHIMATNDLSAPDDQWVDVTNMSGEERKAYHFFKIVLK